MDKSAQQEINRQMKRVMTASATLRPAGRQQILLNYAETPELITTAKLACTEDRTPSLMRSQSACTRRRKLSFSQYEV